ncbi:unnamed protein product [Gongylonema pulchrum]|uniref:Fatty acid hydroxylase domain-containing protein n=1 Tax=Gongylonema pulchrum TaxID=637853 RepID=A0A183DCH7_9BILA|nr:unnamed protein product [Gongylonema pulchrum]
MDLILFLTQESDSLVTDEPILDKVGDLGDRYWTWIHQPHDGTFRLFASDILENMTRTSWWVVPLVWLPLVIIFTMRAFSLVFRSYGELNILLISSLSVDTREVLESCPKLHSLCGTGFASGLFLWAALFTFGVLAWTLLEYILHRYAFHWQPNPKSRTQIILHFLLHGLHHKDHK